MFVLERLSKGDKLSQTGAIHAVGLALSATSPADLRRAVRPQADLGYGMGTVAYNVAVRAPRGEKAPVSRALREVELALKGKKVSASSKIFKTWDAFRPAIALWAAHHILFDDDVPPEMGRFPCSPSDLPRFLAAAEQFRRLAEQTNIPNRAEPLLRPGTHIRLSDEILAKLPEGRIEIIALRPQP